MSEKSIIFSGPMIRAIMKSKKTQTRRIVRGLPIGIKCASAIPESGYQYRFTDFNGTTIDLRCPYGRPPIPLEPADRLWIRETFWPRPFRTPRDMREGADTWPRAFYDADKLDIEELRGWGWKRTPAIFMPRELSRINLEIKAIRVERLRDISEADARAEGMKALTLPLKSAYRTSFCVGWDSINGKRAPWSSNPWVWVIEFSKV